MLNRVRIRYKTDEDRQKGYDILLLSKERFTEKPFNKVIVTENQIHDLIKNKIDFEYV